MELVGSTIVQQAGLSVMNAQKGVLPHGWLEYVDEISGRPYYYNVRRLCPTFPRANWSARCSRSRRPCASRPLQVHTRETTWYKPKPPAEPLIIGPEPGEEGEDGFISLNLTPEKHHIAISAEI